jgi:hypothetical protein
LIDSVVSSSSFLPSEYTVKQDSGNAMTTKFKVRQVPGDGGCLFHSLAVSIAFRRDKSHPEAFDGKLRELSLRLRQLSIDVLGKVGECLVMEGDERIASHELLEMVASNYNMTSADYLCKMADPKTWGGGPEIVALSNYFRRPIHVYELDTCGMWRKQFQLRVCAKFGSPEFDAKCPLYLLCADGRFPHLVPGTQKETGDHFLALFPSYTQSAAVSSIGPPAVRGGSSSSSSGSSSSSSIDSDSESNSGNGMESSSISSASRQQRNNGNPFTKWLFPVRALRGQPDAENAGGYSVAEDLQRAAAMFPDDRGDFDGL